jgi:hypothetical protein
MSGTVFADVAGLEARLGLPRGFYDNLLREDDWSFVIKLNALLEGVCTHVLSARLNAPELIGALAHLDFGNPKCGKVALLRAARAISTEQASIIRSLAELRNELVHNISNVHFSFKGYVNAMDKNQLKALIKNYGHGVQDQVSIRDRKISRHDFVRENPKVSLWLTAAELLACLQLEFEIAKLKLSVVALDEYARAARLSSEI